MYNDNRVKINIDIKVKNESRSRLRSKKSQNLIDIEKNKAQQANDASMKHMKHM